MRHLSEVQLDLEALRGNCRALKALAGEAKVFAVVKANAYGHGLAEVVQALDGQADGFQVDDIEELREVRRWSSARVLVLGYVQASDLAEAAALGGELALYDLERLSGFAQHGVVAHLKVDNLLGRQGVLPERLDEFAEQVLQAGVDVRSAYGHFANIEDTTDLTHAQAQLEVFEEAFALLKQRWPSLQRHVSATSGLMAVERENAFVRTGIGRPYEGASARCRHAFVRTGIGLYGLYPSQALERSYSDLNLQPVMRWVSHLAQVKRIPRGHPVGYGLTYFASREMTIGIVPQGYADGYDRGLTNSGCVLVRGRRCPVVGRVAMNMFAVDLSQVPEASSEDEVVLLGAQGEERITAEEIAARLGTIHYEVVARVSPLLPRTAVL